VEDTEEDELKVLLVLKMNNLVIFCCFVTIAVVAYTCRNLEVVDCFEP